MAPIIAAGAQTAPGLLAHRAAVSPSTVFAARPQQPITYADWHARTDAVARALVELGVRTGDTVALIGANSLAWAAAWWSILKAGAVVAPIEPSSGLDETLDAIKGSEAQVLMGDRAAHARLAEHTTDATGIRHVVGLQDGAGDTTLEELSAGGGDAPLPPVDPGDVAVILHDRSSWSATVLTHANVVASAGMTADALGLREGDRLDVLLSLAHPHGQVCGLLVPALIGGSSRVELDATGLEATESWTVVLADPDILGNLLAAPQAMSLLSSACLLVCAADEPSDVPERFEDAFGVRVLEGFSFPEACGLATLRPGWMTRSPGAAGLALRGQHIAVFDDHGRPCPPGGLGRVCLRGPNVSPGIAPEPTDPEMPEGWCRTGTHGYIDENGLLHLARAERTASSRGARDGRHARPGTEVPS